MNNITKIGDKCVGCRSCELQCPKKCIQYTENKEGFFYPVVDAQNCIDCGKCLQHCPMNDKEDAKKSPIGVYGFKNKDKKRIVNSASGGAADTIVQHILEKQGVVYGCAYDDNFRVHHIEVTSKEESWRLQSSKYVQSDIEDCYKRAESRLKNGELVLFIGTPCQIAGLKSYLGKVEYDNLYTIDLICHGVPSPKLFKKYIEYMENKMGEKVTYYNFRSKEKRGWCAQFSIGTKTKKKTTELALDKYGKHFLLGNNYRESCYQCKYANTSRVSDITVGDLWGVEKIAPEFFSRDGVSLVMINTEKGKKIFEQIQNKVECIPCKLEAVMEKQKNLKGPTQRTAIRDTFYDEIDSDKMIHNLSVGIQLKHRIKCVMPASLIKKIKKILR